MLEAAAAVGVHRLVNISTDKAADPISVLGYSKRITERLTATVATSAEGTFLSVRFGNVLGSRGSVITAFQAQVAAGGPVTVTDPEVTRYFMTVHEAVELVIQAGAIGRDGEVLVLDMGEPVRIADVAHRLSDRAQRRPEVVYTGLRRGEKLHEDLLCSDEIDVRPRHQLITHVPVEGLDRVHVLALDTGSAGATNGMRKLALHPSSAVPSYPCGAENAARSDGVAQLRDDDGCPGAIALDEVPTWLGTRASENGGNRAHMYDS